MEIWALREKRYDAKNMICNKWLILLFNTAIFVVMAFLLPIHFEECDDASMCMIVNGKYSGTPDGRLVYINAAYGWAIAGLYMLADAVEWYTFSFCVFHVLAMTGIVYILMNNKQTSWLLKVLFLAFLYIYWVRIIIAFQFTTTAGLLCFSGCLAMLQPFQNPNASRLRSIWIIVGIIAVFIASMIRFYAAAVVGLLCLPMFIEPVLHSKHYAFWLFGLLVLVCFVRYADRWFYRDPEWAYYREYNYIRGAINDNPFPYLTSNDLPEGVSELDYEMLQRFAVDMNVITLDKLKSIRDKTQTYYSWQKFFDNLKQLRLYLFPILFIIFGLAVSSIVTRNQWKHPMMALLLFFLALLYLGGFRILKYRVFLCLLLPMMYQVLYWCSQSSCEKKLNRVLLLFIVIALVGVCAKFLKQDIGLVKHVNRWKKGMIEEYFKPLIKGKEENWTLCTYTGWASTEYVSPFRYHTLPIRFVELGSKVGSPLNKGVLNSYKDLVDSKILCGRWVKNCPVIMSEAPDKLLEVIKKNYNVDAEVQIVDKNDNYIVYRFVSK